MRTFYKAACSLIFKPCRHFQFPARFFQFIYDRFRQIPHTFYLTCCIISFHIFVFRRKDNRKDIFASAFHSHCDPVACLCPSGAAPSVAFIICIIIYFFRLRQLCITSVCHVIQFHAAALHTSFRIQDFVLRRRLFSFRGKLIERSYRQADSAAAAVLYPVTDCSCIFLLFYSRLLRNLHSVYEVLPDRGILIGKTSLVSVSLLPGAIRKFL